MRRRGTICVLCFFSVIASIGVSLADTIVSGDLVVRDSGRLYFPDGSYQDKAQMVGPKGEKGDKGDPGVPGQQLTLSNICMAISSGNVSPPSFCNGIVGTISGRIETPSGAPVSNALVSISGSNNLSVYSDINGQYQFNGITNGSYTISCSITGYIISPSNINILVNNSSSSTNNFTAYQQAVVGTITGYNGSGLVIQNNKSDYINIPSGATNFSMPITSDSYNITVLQQPISPIQSCVVMNGTGTIGQNTGNIIVDCVESDTLLYMPKSSYYGNPAKVYSLNSTSGSVFYIGSYDFLISSAPNTLAPAYATDLQHKRLYSLVNKTVYSINNSTAIISAVGSFSASLNPSAISIDATGKYAYMTDYIENKIYSYAIDPASGSLTNTGSYDTGNSPGTIAIHISGKFLYTANLGSAYISAFGIDPSTGRLTFIGKYASSGSVKDLSFDPTGLFLYAASGDFIDIYQVNIYSGIITAINTVPATKPDRIALHPTGRFAYVCGQVSSSPWYNITIYKIGAIPGELAKINTFYLDGQKSNIVIDSSGKNLYISYNNSNSISQYVISSANGDLSLNQKIESGAPGTMFLYPLK